MKKQIVLFLIMTILICTSAACDKKKSDTNSDKQEQKVYLLQAGNYFYGDSSSLIDRETITIVTVDKSFIYSSSPFSSYLTYGNYTESDLNHYSFIDEKGTEQSFTVDNNTIIYKDKKFLYGYNRFDKCTMEIVEGTVTPTGLTVRFSSVNENDTHYGSYYRVEKFENDDWLEVQRKELPGELGWTAEAYIIPKDGHSDCEIDWDWLYGELNAGQYRIIKDIYDFRKTGDLTQYYYAAEFVIK